MELIDILTKRCKLLEDLASVRERLYIASENVSITMVEISQIKKRKMVCEHFYSDHSTPFAWQQMSGYDQQIKDKETELNERYALCHELHDEEDMRVDELKKFDDERMKEMDITDISIYKTKIYKE